MKLLIVEDDELMRSTLRAVYKEHDLRWAATVDEASVLLETDVFAAAFLDINLRKGSSGDGISLLQLIRQKDSYLPCIMISAISDVKIITQCLEMGAVDYVVKGSGNADNYRVALSKAQAWRKILAESSSARNLKTPVNSQATEEIRGRSPVVAELRATITKLGAQPGPFLILGQTGTGKELVARALWSSYRDQNRPFIALNCASLPENLVESELFGYERGAFTGALTMKTGLFEAANGGDIFLDEIGELSTDLQAKLLRVLQEKRVRRLGSDKERPVNFRVIAATNLDLLSAVEEGDFRDDLFYRLNVHQIRVPSLRERMSDVPELLSGFLSEMGFASVGLEASAHEALVNYGWPGNIRQLKAFALSVIPYLSEQGGKVTSELVTKWMSQNVSKKAALTPTTLEPEREVREAVSLKTSINVVDKLQRLQRAYVDAALVVTQNNRSQAAKLLGVSRQRLSNWINEWDSDAEFGLEK